MWCSFLTTSGRWIIAWWPPWMRTRDPPSSMPFKERWWRHLSGGWAWGGDAGRHCGPCGELADGRFHTVAQPQRHDVAGPFRFQCFRNPLSQNPLSVSTRRTFSAGGSSRQVWSGKPTAGWAVWSLPLRFHGFTRFPPVQPTADAGTAEAPSDRSPWHWARILRRNVRVYPLAELDLSQKLRRHRAGPVPSRQLFAREGDLPLSHIGRSNIRGLVLHLSVSLSCSHNEGTVERSPFQSIFKRIIRGDMSKRRLL